MSFAIKFWLYVVYDTLIIPDVTFQNYHDKLNYFEIIIYCMKSVISGVVITLVAVVLGLGMISPAAAEVTHILFQGCGTSNGSTVNCTVVWDTNSNGLCDDSDTIFNLVIQEEFVTLLQEKLTTCG